MYIYILYIQTYSTVFDKTIHGIYNLITLIPGKFCFSLITGIDMCKEGLVNLITICKDKTNVKIHITNLRNK